MSAFTELLGGYRIPTLYEAKRTYPRPRVEDPARALREGIAASRVLDPVAKGARVAITAGSRGVDQAPLLLRELAAVLREAGAVPFIVPAMGSHGGATAQGQREILESLGITEAYCGCPILSSMETVLLGHTESGLPVYMDKHAREADHTVLVARVKPHTDFRGEIESGLCKMTAVGLGKQKGADVCHSNGPLLMGRQIEETARHAFANANILFGVATVENAYDELSRLAVVTTGEIIPREKLLLKEAAANLPGIPFDKYDVLVVGEIGKNISGAGMDPNVVGRFASPGMPVESPQQMIAVLDLTGESHGNAAGMGLADFATGRLFRKFTFEGTYANPLTSKGLAFYKMPIIMPSDREAIQAAIKSCVGIDFARPRLVMIKNTLEPDRMLLSEALAGQAEAISGLTVSDTPVVLPFDESGNLF